MVILILVLYAHILSADIIDIGMFESGLNPDEIGIKIRPDFDISEDETITAILYTIRWDDPAVTINTEYIFPFFIAPQGPPVEYNGYYYQVFGSTPLNPIPIAAGEEVIASFFTFTNGECTTFEIIEDDWTQANNGNYYIEFLGLDVTGVIYESLIDFGSIGGIIEGGGTINLGEWTDTLTVTNFIGNIISWQKKLDNGPWINVANTSGQTNYYEIPLVAGIWKYRCEVQEASCPVDYSQPAQVIVLDTIVSARNSAELIDNRFVIFSDGHTIHLRTSNSEDIEGKLLIFNTQGQITFEKHLSGVKNYITSIETKGIYIVCFFDELNFKKYRRKVIIR